MDHVDRARAQYEGKTLTARWEYARGVTPTDPWNVRQAAREELQAIAEEIGDHAHAGRIRHLARLHREALA